MGNRSGTLSEAEDGGRPRGRSEGGAEGGEDIEDLEVEVPPPMRPISSLPSTEDTVKVETKAETFPS